MADQANHMATKDAVMETMPRIIQQLRGEIKTLKTKHSGQSTKKPDSLSYKNEKSRFNKYCCTHGIGRHNGEACRYKSVFHKEKEISLNRMGGIT